MARVDKYYIHFTVFAECFNECLVSGSESQIADENFSGHCNVDGNGKDGTRWSETSDEILLLRNVNYPLVFTRRYVFTVIANFIVS